MFLVQILQKYINILVSEHFKEATSSAHTVM